MSLNKWLCQKFDEEKKVYATIGDIIFYVFANVIINMHIIIFAFTLFFGVGLLSGIFQGFITPTATITEFFIMVLIAWILPLKIIIAIVIAIKVIEKIVSIIFNIKIAKCPLKNQEEEHD